MTPDQQLNAWLLFAPLTAIFVAEMTLLFARPAWLAAVAYLPLGRPRSVLLGPTARAALSQGATYRDAAAGALSLEAVASPVPIAVADLTVRFDPDGRRATFRLPLRRMFAFSGAVAVHLDVDRDAIALRAAMLPTFAPTGAAFFLPLIVMALGDGENPEGATVVAPALLAIFLAVELVGALRSRREFAWHADAVMDALEQRIGALD